MRLSANPNSDQLLRFLSASPTTLTAVAGQNSGIESPMEGLSVMSHMRNTPHLDASYTAAWHRGCFSTQLAWFGANGTQIIIAGVGGTGVRILDVSLSLFNSPFDYRISARTKTSTENKLGSTKIDNAPVPLMLSRTGKGEIKPANLPPPDLTKISKALWTELGYTNEDIEFVLGKNCDSSKSASKIKKNCIRVPPCLLSSQDFELLYLILIFCIPMYHSLHEAKVLKGEKHKHESKDSKTKSETQSQRGTSGVSKLLFRQVLAGASGAFRQILEDANESETSILSGESAGRVEREESEITNTMHSAAMFARRCFAASAVTSNWSRMKLWSSILLSLYHCIKSDFPAAPPLSEEFVQNNNKQYTGTFASGSGLEDSASASHGQESRSNGFILEEMWCGASGIELLRENVSSISRRKGETIGRTGEDFRKSAEAQLFVGNLKGAVSTLLASGIPTLETEVQINNSDSLDSLNTHNKIRLAL